MKVYNVIIPICGYYETTVEAKTEKEAIEIALDKGYEKDDFDLYWESFRKIIDGNVFHGEYNEAYAEEL